jgi:hypothetical protein
MRRAAFLPLLSAACAAGLLITPSTARAGWRIFEKDTDNPDTAKFLEIGGYAQPGLFAYIADKTAQQYSGDNPWTGFLLQRARVNLKIGFTRYFIASVEVEAVGAPSLTDAYVESRILRGLNFRLGQFLVPNLQSYQFSEINTGFIDREVYLPQTQTRQFISYLQPRDIGIMLFGYSADTSPARTDPVLEYAVGIFNGNGSNNPSNAHRAFMYTARLQLDILGFPEGRYTENDFARNKTPRVAVGTGGFMNCDTEHSWNRGFTADAEFRYQGLYASASFVWIKNSGATGVGSGIAHALDYDYQCKGGGVPANLANGGHLQLQYFLPASAFEQGGGVEFLGRWDAVNPFNAPTSFIGGNPPAGGLPAPTVYDGQTDILPSRWRLTLGMNWYPIGLTSVHLSANWEYVAQTEPIIVPDVGQVLLSTNIFWLQLTAGI